MTPTVMRELVAELWVPATPEDVFSFFADPFNLDELTPASLRFEILTPAPIEVREGTVIDYRLSIHRIPLRWRSLITSWEPPHRFVDEQVRGPYRYWRHEHLFSERAGGTLIRDHVRYSSPGRILEPILHRLFVRPDLERIFRYRTAHLGRRFGASRAAPPA